MKRLNAILSHLPTFIYSYSVVLPFVIVFATEWYKSNYNTLEIIDFVLCIICLIHSLFNFNNYSHLAKSSFVVMIIVSIYHLIYYSIDIDNETYYTIYAILLAINPLYFLTRTIIKN